MGFPVNVPFIIALDYNTSSEEVCLVTARAGTNFTVTRAYDGTSGTSHNAGAAVRHTWSAIDGTDSRVHEGSSSGVHGVVGALVGTSDSQVLTNKSLTSPALTGTVTGSAIYDAPTDRNSIHTNSADSTVPLVANAIVGTTANLAELKLNGSNRFAVDVSGQPSAALFASSYVESSTPGTANTSSVTYVDTGTAVSTTIVVPPSGKVLINARVEMFNGTGGSSNWSTINVVGSVSGSLRASVDAKALEARYNANMGGANIPGHESFVQTAVPGETLTVKWQHRTTAGTLGIDYRSITAVPLIG